MESDSMVAWLNMEVRCPSCKSRLSYINDLVECCFSDCKIVWGCIGCFREYDSVEMAWCCPSCFEKHGD